MGVTTGKGMEGKLQYQREDPHQTKLYAMGDRQPIVSSGLAGKFQLPD
jgi:hypothetical protein